MCPIIVLLLKASQERVVYDRNEEQRQMGPKRYTLVLMPKRQINLFHQLGKCISLLLPGGCNPQPAGHMRPRMAVNVAPHKIVNLLKTFFFCSSIFISVCVFNVWPDTILLPVWPRDAQKVGHPCELF